MIKTAQDMKSYKKQLRQALDDTFLRSALDKFNTVYRENRPNVYKDIDFHDIRDEIADNKDSLIPYLEDLFQEFKINAEKAGAKVHRAKDAREANEIITTIARENSVKKIVKAKSMTAEETFLNDHMEKEGFMVTETDLGEWIIQLKHEGPSHMVMPAIHLSRYQVGELFEKETLTKLDSENIDKLVREVCPVGIDLPHLIKKTHARVIKEDGKIPVKNFLLSKVMKNRKLFHFILRQAYLVQQPFSRGKPMIRHIPSFFEKDHGFRSLPVIAKKPLRDQWSSLHQKLDKSSLKVALFAGCAMDFIYPEHGKDLLRLLNKTDIQIDFPVDQTCCGLPAMMAAEEKTARQIAIDNINAFSKNDYDYILTLCASCASHLTHNYEKIFKEESETSLDITNFTRKIIDFSSFMDKFYPFPQSSENIDKKVAYHAPCHLCRGLHITDQPRALIQNAGYTYVQSKDEDVCCGFGGSYSVDFPEISSQILKKKLDSVEESGAHILVTDCPGCVMQLRGGFDKRQSHIKVLHLVELLAADSV